MAELPDLTDDQWRDLIKRLTVFARARILRLNWRGGCAPSSADVAATRFDDPSSLVQEAILSVIEGRRACVASDPASLLEALKSIVNSLVHHAVEAVENRRVRPDPGVGARGGLHDPAAPRSAEPGVALAEAELADRFRARIRARLGKDEEASGVLDCLDADVTKPADIAIVMEAKVTDVNNAQKRLRRVAREVQEEFRKAEHGRSRPTR